MRTLKVLMVALALLTAASAIHRSEARVMAASQRTFGSQMSTSAADPVPQCSLRHCPPPTQNGQ